MVYRKGKYLMIFILFFALLFFGSHEASAETDGAEELLSFEWGMSQSEVKELEDVEPARETDHELFYVSELAGIDVVIVYFFRGDELERKVYDFVEEHEEINTHVEDFQKVRSALIESLGEPTIDEELWFDDRYQDETEKYGRAVSEGHLTYLVEWKLEDAQVVHILDEHSALEAAEDEEKEINHLIMIASSEDGAMGL